MIPGKGVVADFDRDGVDDFVQGLDFNEISSVFDPYKPNAPVLSVANGTYFITIGEITMPVVATVGGTGKAAQLFLVRVPVTDTADHLSQGNYVAPLEFDERDGSWKLFNPSAWYDDSGNPRFDASSSASDVAEDNTSSFAKDCASCHVEAVRDLRQTAAGEWVDTPFPATLVPPGDPGYVDTNHDGLLDVVNVQCEACHGPGSAHILGAGDPAKIVNPADLDTAEANQLCGQCHCDQQGAGTEHPAVTVCPAGAHTDTQADVASELAEERAGQTPDDVIHGEDAENCIACHGPTAVMANGGMSETDALGYFFTTENGAFTSETVPDHTSTWPSVACTVCHNQHGADTPELFDSTSGQYKTVAGTAELCGQCHGNLRFPDTDHLTYNQWAASPHGNTQDDVAAELSEERVGQTPDDVVHGDDAENCIACHGPGAVLANGGMTESQALGYFFTTTDGAFSDATVSNHSAEWPDVSCVSCHDQHDPAAPAYFNSLTRRHEPKSASELCGQCHGSLRFEDTDHLTYDAWKISRHSATQDDVASELAEERAGQTPEEVIHGDDAENCIACHGPTAVLANGGMTEVQALDYFFTTTDGTFDSSTTIQHASEWPNVSCTACHDQHDPSHPAYFNSSTGEHVAMGANQLCGQCHGNLRFPDTDHLSYNMELGTGGVGVPNQTTMPGAGCTDCHMYADDVDGSNSSMYHGHSWAITVKNPDGSETVSCTHCHSSIVTDDDYKIVLDLWRQNFQVVDSVTKQNVAAAEAALEGIDNPDLEAKLAAAQHNLDFAESDESGGFHNHLYLMSLLFKADSDATEILTELGK
ncbi:MAG TPA: hypothetical protein ENK19_06905 [Acidobacteria bacterium]|nr:hypothetical protein [Acidobacteriota bacterium]